MRREGSASSCAVCPLVEDDDRPQVKSGWGTGATTNTNSNIGMSKKSNAAAYWDNKTTELVIPEVEADDQQDYEVAISAPQTVQTEMIGLQELS